MKTTLRRLIGALLCGVVTMPATAATLAWNWVGDETKITRFIILADGVQVYEVKDPKARSADATLAKVTGGKSYAVAACSAASCGEASVATYVPVAPTNVVFTVTATVTLSGQ